MLGINTIALIAALSAPASAGSDSAATHELNWEVNSVGVTDENWGVFSNTNSVAAWGVGGGYGLSRNLTLMVGLHHRKYVNDTDYYYDEDWNYLESDLETSFSTSQLSVGPKLNIELKPWLRPYVTGQALLRMGTIGADDDTRDDDNLNQLSWSAISPGIRAAAGFDIVPVRGDTVHIASHLDFGYSASTALNFTDDAGSAGDTEAPVGKLGLSGLHISWGIGVHF
jgi:hypothetical protein